MKSKEKKELHQKSVKELSNLIAEARNALNQLKLDKTQNKLKNTRLIFLKRREIAQMLTIVRMKELTQIKEEKKE